MDWAQIIQNVGIMGTLVLLLIWIQWKRDMLRDESASKRESRVAGENRERESRMENRISILEAFVNTELLGLVKETQLVMIDNTKAMVALTSALSTKPCLLGSDQMTDQIAKAIQIARLKSQEQPD